MDWSSVITSETGADETFVAALINSEFHVVCVT